MTENVSAGKGETDPADVASAVAQIETALPGWDWSLAKITDRRHCLPPFGPGWIVGLQGAGCRINEKRGTLPEAVEAALAHAGRALEPLEAT